MDVKNLNRFKREDLVQGFPGILTVGDLKKFITRHNLTDDSIVLIERVEDFYYTEHKWRVYLKEGYGYDPDLGEEGMTQYHPAFCCAYHPDDEDILFIDLHF